MRKAAADLEFETAARLRDELKRLKLMDLEFANDLATPAGEAGEAVDTAEPGRLRKAAREEREEAFRKGAAVGGYNVHCFHLPTRRC